MAEFVRAIGAEEAPPEGEGRSVEVEGRDIALFNVGGTYYAVEDRCPHQDGPLGDGHVEDKAVVCPLHFWEFDIETGEYLDDPSVTVRTYEVKVDGGDVLVRVGDDDDEA